VGGVRVSGGQRSVLDRFTLDEVSAKIWWPLAMVALVALVLTVPAGNHAADRARREAAANAIAISAAQIEPLTSRDASVADMDQALSEIQQANPTFDVVRLWDDQRLLVASSLHPDPLQLGTAFNDNDINGAISGGSRLVVTDRLPTGDPGPTTVHAYTKINGGSRGPMVTEFEANDATLLAEVHEDWNGYRIVAGVAFLLLLGLALLSMREPVADIGTGVPFYPASLPPNLAIVDAERAVVIDHEDGHVRQKVDSLQQRLDESERLRLKAEARLQQALTTLGTGGRNVPGLPPEPPTPTLPASRQSGRRAKPASIDAASTAPAIEAAPRSDIAPLSEAPPPTPPPGALPDPAIAASTARQKRSSKKRLSKRRGQRPAVERTPAPRRSRAEEPAAEAPGAEAPAEAPVTPSVDVPAAKAPSAPEVPAAGSPERIEVVADDVTVSAQTPNGSAPSKEKAPEVVVLPSEQPSTVGTPKAAPSTAATPSPKPVATPSPKPAATPASKPAPAPTEADAAADALRRAVPSGEPSPEPLDDPADLRARLARTAALKKPGSKERQDQRDALQGRTSEQ
jgi:hypothetical protein